MEQIKRLGIIGIDASYNSTGICVIYIDSNGDRKTDMYRLSPDSDTSRQSAHIKQLKYPKIYTETKDFETDDLGKIENCKRITLIIKKLMTTYEIENGIQFWDIRFEGNVMNSFGRKGSLLRIVDMVYLTGVLKANLNNKKSICSVYAITELKKIFCGRGSPKRELNPKTGKKEAIEDSKLMMVNKFISLYPSFDKKGKIDDVVDAYALAKAPLKNQSIKREKIDKYFASL